MGDLERRRRLSLRQLFPWWWCLLLEETFMEDDCWRLAEFAEVDEGARAAVLGLLLLLRDRFTIV